MKICARQGLEWGRGLGLSEAFGQGLEHRFGGRVDAIRPTLYSPTANRAREAVSAHGQIA